MYYRPTGGGPQSNDRELMGPHVNGRLYNAFAWTIAVVVSMLSLVLIAMTGMDWLR